MLQLRQLKLELHNAIHTHDLKPTDSDSDSYLVAKSYVPVNGLSSHQHPHRIPLKPTAKKPYVSRMLRGFIKAFSDEVNAKMFSLQSDFV